MGNSSSREARNSQDRGSNQSQTQSPTSPTFSFSLNPPQNDRNGGIYSSRSGRGSRGDLSLFSMGSSGEVDPNGQRRETKQEREARKLEKERVLRARERERSLREEGVDGGYLVTLGTYVGPEDFSKATVRQLQIERRLAPFWRGLDDHSDSWTEHQLVAAARGQTIPPPDQIPPQDESPSPTEDRRASATNQSSSSTPLPTRPVRGSSDASQAHLTPTTSNISNSPSNATPSPLFRGRNTKPLASLSSGTNRSQSDIPRNEMQLPKQPQINGQPVEAFLYKDVAECPICFLYYPPYLNRTRCCDQPICSECFVQIKRPDPHPPEHTDPNSPPPENQEQPPPGEEGQLVSEEATCPFCKMPQLGITYDAPPFRRGLAYATEPGPPSSSRSGGASRRPRGQSMSASHPDVITTDMVRPDWAKKLADARSHQARRSAAATALHTAAYMMNDRGGGFAGLGRRRRTVLMEGGQGSSTGAPRPDQMNPAHLEQIMAVLESQEQARRDRRGNGNGSDIFPSRGSSRSNRPEDLEELMMMEAIRLSIQAEEDRKKKEEREAEKERKKQEKQRAKDKKAADKAARKGGASSYSSSRNNSGLFTQTSNEKPPSPPEGKGKGRAGQSAASGRGYQPGGFNPLDEPTSTLNSEPAGQQKQNDAQRHLEQSRSNLSSDRLNVPSNVPRSTSFTSVESSTGEAGTHVDGSNDSSQLLPPIPTTSDHGNSSESMFNFSSLNEMIDNGQTSPSAAQETAHQNGNAVGSRSRGASGSSQQPPRYQEEDGSSHSDTKHAGNVAVVGRTGEA